MIRKSCTLEPSGWINLLYEGPKPQTECLCRSQLFAPLQLDLTSSNSTKVQEFVAENQILISP